MDSYKIEAEGNGFRVCKTFPDGRVWLVGRFPNKGNAQLWIDEQVNMTNRRKDRRFASHDASQDSQ
jgi:hypothetical protein